MPFVVDDILIGWLIVPLAMRLRDRLLDQIADVADENLRKLLRRLVLATEESQPQAREESVQVAAMELASYVEKNRDAAAELAALAIADVAENAAGNERLEGLYNFINYMFRMVEYLKRPVVLPGFFTGSDQTTVIDVRTATFSAFELPKRLWGAGWPESEGPRIQIDLNGPLLRAPRIWVIPSASEGPADLKRRPPLPPHEFGVAMQDQWRVKSITPTAVGMVHMRFLTALERMGRTQRERDEDLIRERERMFEMSATPDGVVSMRDALIRAVKTESDRRQDWNLSWADALRIRTP
jgi:hypothetical protein